MAKILFYGAFRAIVGQAAIEQKDPNSSLLSKVFNELLGKFSNLKPAMFIPNMETLRPEVLLLCNGELIRDNATGVLVHPDNQIVIMHQNRRWLRMNNECT
jgi:hypothetical protein